MMIVKKMRVSGIILSFYEETVMGPKKKGGKKDKGKCTRRSVEVLGV